MQQMNPDQKYYSKLAGSYSSEDGTWKAVLPPYSHIEITCGEGRLESSYGVAPVDPMTGLAINQSMGFIGMMQAGKCRTVPYPGEEVTLKIGDFYQCDAYISAGETKLYHLVDAWYGNDTLNLQVTKIGNEEKETIVLRRLGEENNNSGSRCVCGYAGEMTKFCPNCGRARS